MKHQRPVAPNLTVSIVVYNSSLELLRSTLLSLRSAARQALAAGLQGVDVILVDNGSERDYQHRLRALAEEVCAEGTLALEVRTLPVNLGFGAGHNRALARATGDYHLILNPDVEIAEDALAQGFRRLRDDTSVVMVSPLAVGGNGSREFLGKRYPSVLVLLLRAFMPGLGRRILPRRMARYEMQDACTGDTEAPLLLASGCFMLVRGECLTAVEGFDERYFLYFEDFDLSLRLGRLGKLLFAPQVRIVHHGGYAARKGWRHLQMFMRSGLRFFNQHGWRWI